MAARSFALIGLMMLVACSDDAAPVEDVAPTQDAAAEASLVDRGVDAYTPDRVPPSCPSYAEPAAAGSLDSVAINEASGLVHSRQQSNVLWLHNDSGDLPRLFAINSEGKLLGIFGLDGAQAVDWEDIALGPKVGAAGDWLYVGDFGDNAERRPSIQIYRVAEPTVAAAEEPLNEVLQGVERIELRYPDGAHNAETLLVDPVDLELLVITKSDTAVSQIFSAPIPAHATEPIVLQKKGELHFGEGVLADVIVGLATAGDISADGSEILLRTYDRVIWWTRHAGQSVAMALAGEPCFLPAAAEPQGETVAFSPVGDYFTLSEGQGVALYRYARQ